MNELHSDFRQLSQAPPQETMVGYGPHWYSRAPLHIVIILISAIWLLPTVTLLFTSVRSIQNISTSIWWTLLWKPHQFTLGELQHRAPPRAPSAWARRSSTA